MLPWWTDFKRMMLCFILLPIRAGIMMSEEKKLIKKLLEQYEEVGIVGRPVQNTTQTVTVTYGLALIQILDLDEKNQVLTTNVWTRYEWDDILLQWQPEKYGGVELVRVPPDKIWTPDIVLYNYADVRLKEHRTAMILVSHNGHVFWLPTAIYKSNCQIEILYFPFDYQTCHMKFGSWTYDGYKLDVVFYLNQSRINTDDYNPNPEWELVDAPANKNIKYYPCCPEPYPDLTFTMKLKRSGIFYIYVIVLPCILLSLLTLVIFFIRPESPAKTLLGMNVFVSFFFLLRILSNLVPPAATTVPLIGAFFCLNMVLITLSLFVAVTVINLHCRGDKKNKLPPWLKRVAIDHLAKLFCLYVPDLPGNKRSKEHVTYTMDTYIPDSGRVRAKKRIKSPVLKTNKFDPATDNYRNSPMVTRSHPQESPEAPQEFCKNSLVQDIKDIKRAFKQFQNKLYETDARSRVIMEWRVVAQVIDRIFFSIYVTAIVVSLGTIFPWVR